ncbi:hypothetical protein TWF718_011413 [Orbilia javanica]|uniref:Uncharacterized protein n=1 Tax=Orbilia javanica TaxID=47235 RepID=A0AAN8RHB7_9PEZI
MACRPLLEGQVGRLICLGAPESSRIMFFFIMLHLFSFSAGFHGYDPPIESHGCDDEDFDDEVPARFRWPARDHVNIPPPVGSASSFCFCFCGYRSLVTAAW